MKALSSFLFVLFFSGLIGQTVKTYQGPFEDGNATYQYYENDDYERIYNGSFKFSRNDESVSGNFINNKRTGLWTFVIKREADGLYYVNGHKTTIKGNYTDGKLDGLWTYTRIENNTNKVFKKSSVTFKNGKKVGKYEYFEDDNNFYSTPLSVVGYFDDNGFAIGEWKINYSNEDGVSFEEVYKCEADSIYWSINRNLGTGEIIKRFDVSQGNGTKVKFNYPEKVQFDYILSFWNCIQSYPGSGYVNCSYNELFTFDERIIGSEHFSISIGN